MTRDNDFVSDEIEASVTFVLRRVAKEYALDGARCEFMWSGGREVGKAAASEDTEVIVGGWRAEQSLVRCLVVQGFGGVEVKETSDGV